MTTLREAAQAVLDRWDSPRWTWHLGPTADLMATLRAALAEPVQEPVAWMVYTEGGASAYVTDNPRDLIGAYRALPLYAAPPQRLPLTDEEIDAEWRKAASEEGFTTAQFVRTFARAIERAHGIGDKDGSQG